MRGKFTPALPKIGSITYTFHQGNSRDSSDFDIYDIGVSGLGIIIGMAGYWPATPLVPINSSGIYIDPVGANTNPNTYNGATASFELVCLLLCRNGKITQWIYNNTHQAAWYYFVGSKTYKFK